MSDGAAACFAGKRILITGGLGMIGSTIGPKLVAAGSCVKLVDACIEPYGANVSNIDDLRDRIEVNISDIRDRESMKVLGHSSCASHQRHPTRYLGVVGEYLCKTCWEVPVRPRHVVDHST